MQNGHLLVVNKSSISVRYHQRRGIKHCLLAVCTCFMTVVKQWSAEQNVGSPMPQQEAVKMLFDFARISMWDKIM